MKKLNVLTRMLLLVALLVGSTSSVWADSKPWSCNDPSSTLDLKTVTSSNIGTFTDAKSYYIEDDYLLVSGCASRNSTIPTWIAQKDAGSSDSNVSTNWVASTPFKGNTAYTTAKYATLQSGRAIVYKVTNLKSLKVYGKNNSTSKYLDIFIYTKSEEVYTKVEEIKYTTDNNVHIWSNNTTLSPSETYYIYITGAGSSNSQLYEVAFERNTSNDPFVSANDVSIYADETSGEIAYTVGNPEVGGVVSAAEKVDVDWLSDVAIDGANNKVTFNATENASTQRTATITITYTYSGGSKTATKDVTVTQKKHVDYSAVYEKATAETMVIGGSYVWYGEKENTGAYLAKGLGGETFLGAVALGTDSRVRENELSLTDETGVQTFTFAPLDTYTEWNILLGSDKLGIDGDKKLYVNKGDQSWTMNGTGSEAPTFSATYDKSTYTMYANISSTRFNAYTSIGSMQNAILYHLATESNHTLTLDPNDGASAAATYHVKDGYSFVPYVPTRAEYTFIGWNTKSDGTGTSYGTGAYTMPAAATTLYAQWRPNTVSATVTSAGWATYVTPYAVEFSEGDAYVVTAAGTSTTLEAVTKVPADTPVLLKDEGTKTATVIASATDPASNLLKVSNGSVVGDDATIYVLANKDNGVGFYLWDKTAAAIPEGKVYLDTKGSGAKGLEFISFENAETDGIKAVSTKVENGVRYNLAGQKVGADYKGIVIVNGKKMLNK